MVNYWIEIKKVIKKADIVLEVVDARDPLSTRSRKIENLAKRLGKKLIIVINKADLVPKEVLDKWKRLFEREFPTIYIGARDRLGTRWLWRIIKKLSDKKPVLVAVVGLPNVGKSTIINILRGRKSAGTSPIAGFTKSTLTVRAATWLKVIDTPGIIPYGKEDQLALRGALRPESLEDPLTPALKLLEEIISHKPEIIREVYKVEVDSAEETLKRIAVRRGLLTKGGVINIEEAARIVIRDWQTGKIKYYRLPP